MAGGREHKIFLSYRRADAGGYTGWLHQLLVGHLEDAEVFRDIDSIQGGEKWVDRLERVLARCDVLVAVIGPEWLTADDEKGRRLDDPRDRVRLELEAALRRGVPLIPTLVGGARMPPAEELPASLQPLCDWQAVRMSDESWETDLAKLIRGIERALGHTLGELQLGTSFAGHRIEEEIGHGGMGVLYRGRHEALGRIAAIKVIAPDLARDAEFRERFVNESRIAAEIPHANILTVFDAGEEDGLLYLTMQLVEGGDLASLLIKQSPLTLQHALQVLAPVAAALEAAHEHGLVHRDVKPGNILIDNKGGVERVYLGDFGLARTTTSSTGLTSTGHWVGTADYVAPEQVMGEEVDGRADVYSLGCVLFEMLAGRVPFAGKSDTAKLVAHATKDPPSLLDLRPDLPASVDGVIKKAMAREPAERYASPRDLSAALGVAIASSERNDPELAAEGAHQRTVVSAQQPRPEPREIGSPEVISTAPPQSSLHERDHATVVDAPGPAAAVLNTDPGTDRGASDGPGPSRGIRTTARSGRLPLVGGALGIVAAGVVAAVLATSGGSGTSKTSGASAAIRSTARSASDRARVTGVRSYLTGRAPSAVAVGEGSAWIANYGDDTVTRLDETSGAVVGSPIHVGKEPEDLAVGGGVVWVACYGDDSVTRIDARSGKVIGKPIHVGKSPTAIAVGEGGVWVVNEEDGTLTRLDTGSGAVIGGPIHVGRRPVGIAIAQGSVWVANYGDDTATRVNARLGVPDGTPIHAGKGPILMAAGAGSIWVTDKHQKAVTRIDASTGTVVGRAIPVGRDPVGIAVGGGSVWVANYDDGTVTRIDATSGNVVGSSIRVGKYPVEVAVGKGGVWIANGGDNSASVIGLAAH